MPKTIKKTYVTRAYARANRALVASELVPCAKDVQCAKCGFKGRLYRPLYEFYRPASTRCKRCLEHVKTTTRSYYGVEFEMPEWYASLRMDAGSDLPYGEDAPWDDDKRRESFKQWFAQAENSN